MAYVPTTSGLWLEVSSTDPVKKNTRRVFIGLPTYAYVPFAFSSCSTVAVYGMSNEYKSILQEVKNGAVSPFVYVLAKTIIVIPIFFLFAIFSLALPLYVVQDAHAESIGIIVTLFACMMFVFESLAECLSVWFDNPVAGMLSFSTSAMRSCHLSNERTRFLTICSSPHTPQCVFGIHSSCTMVS